ncbi:hypothetical protein HYS93_00010 [Candidatus Daviesbacteria bacterium]|nr:hypothetical protein [Candidatus Daviesbacteria bacterium]
MEPVSTNSTSAQNGSPKLIYYWISAFVFIAGLGLGFLLFKFYPMNQPIKQTANVESKELKLPSDASIIQKCANRRGTLYIRPSDIPVGPIYMVNQGKIIGIEFMLAQEEFIKGKNYDSLMAGLSMDVNHVNIGLLSHGHEGYPNPHYHVDIYNISPAEEKLIQCSEESPMESATGSSKKMDMPKTMTASPSAH